MPEWNSPADNRVAARSGGRSHARSRARIDTDERTVSDRECVEPRCGQVGRTRMAGWITVTRDGLSWSFCDFACLSYFATRQEISDTRVATG